MSGKYQPSEMALKANPALATLYGKPGPAVPDPDVLAMTCSKALEFHTGPATATHLLAYQDPDGSWVIKPRCAEHPAEADARLLRAVWPAMPIMSILLDQPGPLALIQESMPVLLVATEVVHPNCKPASELGECAHDPCPDCEARWCEPSLTCRRETYDRHPRIYC